ncbi:MAG: hypothetical protein J6J30_00485 [Clostridia bacterium]|jgi:hypothetical protein|nr:hypothetical protein [Clostridia bacterium]MEE1075168.1 hypothetical protein [Acutalibacteraceae bacterium]
MANDLKDAWKETGRGLGHAFRDLGKTLVKTGTKAVKKADEWANRDDNEETASETEDQ